MITPPAYRAVQPVADLLTRHAREWREVEDGVFAVQAADGSWGLWVRSGTHASRWADLNHPDDAGRVYAYARSTAP